jgi:fatty-acid peroxygenase
MSGRGASTSPHDGAAGIIATHRDLDGEELDVETAAVELLNVLRAVVAVARFIVSRRSPCGSPPLR